MSNNSVAPEEIELALSILNQDPSVSKETINAIRGIWREFGPKYQEKAPQSALDTLATIASADRYSQPDLGKCFQFVLVEDDRGQSSADNISDSWIHPPTEGQVHGKNEPKRKSMEIHDSSYTVGCRRKRAQKHLESIQAPRIGSTAPDGESAPIPTTSKSTNEHHDKIAAAITTSRSCLQEMEAKQKSPSSTHVQALPQGHHSLPSAHHPDAQRPQETAHPPGALAHPAGTAATVSGGRSCTPSPRVARGRADAVAPQSSDPAPPPAPAGGAGKIEDVEEALALLEAGGAAAGDAVALLRRIWRHYAPRLPRR